MFRYVSAAFAVPYLDCAAATTSYSSHWVGLDGLGSASVEQVGIEADCAGSTPRYYAWYEIYPKPVSVAFTVRAGNTVQASVTYKRSARKFVLMLRDTSSGRHYTRTLKCAAKVCLRNTFQIVGMGDSSHELAAQPTSLFRGQAFSTYWFRAS